MKIMLDECVTEAPAKLLIGFIELESPTIEAHFLVDYFGERGLKDSPWAQKLSDEGGWFDITADRGRMKKNRKRRAADGPPLHKILPELGITAVYYSGKIQNDTGLQKVRAITSVWPDIHNFFLNAEPGSRNLITKFRKGFLLRDF